MALFLTVHARYHDVQWGLFQDGRLLISEAVESKKMSKQFIILLDSMLRQRNLSLKDLSFIAVHQGPAPFTTLRVCLSTVNGIGFATGLPLIGVNGLDALLDEHTHAHDGSQATVVLLNAFANDIYYGLYDHTSNKRSLGYAPGKEFLTTLKQNYSGPITFLGNAYDMYKEQIEQLFSSNAHKLPIDMVSLEQIAQTAFTKWNNKETEQQIMPVYLKEHSTPTKPSVTSK